MTVNMILKIMVTPIIFFLPGYILFNILTKERMEKLDIETLFLQILGSILTSGWMGLTLAEIGHFSLFNLVASLLIICGLLGWKYKIKFNLKLFTKPRLERGSLVLIIILLVAVGLFFPPYQWILGGRDPGVYVNTGVNIAKTGSIIIHDKLLADIDESARGDFYQIETRPNVLSKIKYDGSQFLGYYITDKMTGEVTPQFFYLWSTWIAIFYSIFGLKFGTYVTPFFVLLSILSIYFTGKTLFNKNVGLIALILLTLNFAQVWYARYPTTEIFTQLLIFSGIFTFILFNRSLNRYLGLISALSFGEAFLTRIDSVYLIIPITLFFVYLWSSDKLEKDHLCFLVPFVIIGIHGIISAVSISAPYTFDTFGNAFNALLTYRSHLILVATIILGAFVILANIYKNNKSNIVRFVQSQNLTPYIRYSTILLIFILIFYSYFIRPTGDLKSDSYNLVKLSWYLSGFYGILLAGTGYVLLLYKKPYHETYFFSVIFIIYSIFYIASSQIYPDHPWWVRRYVPVVIPSTILCISYFLDWIKNLKIGTIHSAVPIFLLILMSIPSIIADSVIISHKEFDGSMEDIDKLSNVFDDNSIILYKSSVVTEYVGTPLYYIYGKEIRPVIISKKSIDKMKEWISDGKIVYLINVVDDITKYENRVQLIKFSTNWNTYSHMDWKGYYGYIFLPGNLYVQKNVYDIVVLKNLSDLDKIQMLSSGWYDTEYPDNIASRWISNSASIFVSSMSNKDSEISFKVESFYEPRTLQIFINDELIHEQEISTDFVSIKIPLRFKNGTNVIRFNSLDGCQKPMDISKMDSNDGRCLSMIFQNMII